MTTIKLTPARVELLRAVAAGEVKHHRTWDLKKPNYDTIGHRRVTAEMGKLREHGLVRIGRSLSASAFSAQVWDLTEAGEQWLAENGENH